MTEKSVAEVSIDAIQVIDRLRASDSGKVASLADSIKKLGLMNPISIRPDNRLIAGLHRLEACKLLGWSTIPAIIQDYHAIHAADVAELYVELAEIDENLIRNDLTELQQGLQHARRKAIYEKLHPEAKAGVAQAKGMNTALGNVADKLSATSYAADAANAVGETERTVRRKTRIGEQLAEVAEQLQDTAIEDNQSELLALAKLQESKPEIAAQVIEELVKIKQPPKPVEPKAAKKKDGVGKPRKKETKSPQAKPVTIKTIVADLKKKQRIEDVQKQAEAIQTALPGIPTGPFHVISIDPPWPYGTPYDPHGRRAANPYPEMSLDDIKAIQLPAAPDCVLWLWTTHKFMRHSFELLDAWGFRDVAILTWVKDRIGLGTWLRSQSEFCIMAVKGKPPISLTDQATVLHGPLREHSRKPDSFYEMVNGLCVGAKLDYFSREKRDGWEQVGNTPELFDEAA